MKARVAQRILSAESFGLLLVIMALEVLTYGISSSLRGTDTTFLFPVCLAAALISLGLSKRHLNGIQASVWIAALGIVCIWILGAGLASPLLDLLKASAKVIPQLNPALRSPIVVEKVVIVEAWNTLAQQSLTLWTRLQIWMTGLSQNTTVNDALVRNIIWTSALWIFAAWAGWFAGRHNAIAALLPSIGLLAVIAAYSGRRVEALWLMVSILLLLMGVWNYRNHMQRWEMQKVDYSESIRIDSGLAVLFLTIVIGVFAFITPSVSWREIRDYLRERDRATHNETADMLGIQERRASAQNPEIQKPSLPREHLLSGGYAQSEKIVMTISTGELPPLDETALVMPVPRYYWRSLTYDVYIGAGWVTSSAAPQRFQPNTPLIPGLLAGYRLVHLDVDMVQLEGKLFWSGILFSADVPFTANWRVRPQSSLFANQSALLQADMFAAVSKAASYQADVYVPAVTIRELRAASTQYPDFIQEHYLSLPQSVPERVHQLAREIVSGKTNTYDKAKAIEAYLRTYPYDLNIPAPPTERDVADYFLFDLGKGYCDYYATALVVLARSSGIPARFVSGYSPGVYDAPNARYVIRELNAHSWAEIYFPGIGWVEFEPTGSQPEIERLAGNLPESNTTNNAESKAATLLNQFRLERVMIWTSPMLAILFLVLLYFLVIEKWWYMRLSPATAIERIYRSFYRLGRPLAGAPVQAETAYEFMDRLTNKMEEIRQRSKFTKLFVETKSDIIRLTNIYCKSLFSQNHTHKYDAIIALNIWRQLRLQLMIARMTARLKREKIIRPN